MVTLGQTTRTTSENRTSLRLFTLLRMLQAASMPMTVVLPVPVAILHATRWKPPYPSAFRSSLGSPGHVNSLEEIGPRLGQEDDALHRLALGEEEPMLPPFAGPVVEQLERRPGHPGPACRLPRFQALTDPRDELQLDQRSGIVARGVAHGPRRSVVVRCRPPTGRAARGLALDEMPVLGRLVVGFGDDRLGDFEAAHNPNALLIPSSFSTTSGWISCGVITAAISW